MKKILAAMLVVMTLFSAVPVFAGNVDFEKTFSDLGNYWLCGSSKNDGVQYWYLTIKSGPSSTNVFGGRPKFNSGNAASYRTWTTTIQSKKYDYKENLVGKGDYVDFNGKKDDSSTNNNSLKVVGVFCP